MRHEHLTWPRLFQRLRRNEEPGSWLLELPLTLIHSCPGCRERCGDLLEILAENDSQEFAQQVDFLDLALIRSRRRARARWQRFPASIEATRAQLETGPASYGMVELLVDESRRHAAEDLEKALAYATMAVAMAPRLPTRLPGDDTLVGADDEEPLDASAQAEALALAHGVLGNAHRVRRELIEAEAAFEQAGRYLQEVEFCLFEGRARVLSMQGSLLTDKRRLHEAVEVLERAEAALRQKATPDPERQAELLYQLSVCWSLLDDPQAAIGVLKPYLKETPTPTIRPWLRLAIQHHLAGMYATAGATNEAQALLSTIRVLADRHGTELDQLRVQWLKGRIAYAEKAPDLAFQILKDTQDGFVEHGRIQEAAVIALEVILALIALGEQEAAVDHARTALAILVPLRVSTEAMIAFSVVLRDAAKNTLNADLTSTLILWVSGGDFAAKRRKRDDLP